MGSKRPAVKTILDCLRRRDQSSNGAIATAALLFGTGESGFLRMLAAAAVWKSVLSLERHCPSQASNFKGITPPAGLAKWASADRP